MHGAAVFQRLMRLVACDLSVAWKKLTENAFQLWTLSEFYGKYRRRKSQHVRRVETLHGVLITRRRDENTTAGAGVHSRTKNSRGDDDDRRDGRRDVRTLCRRRRGTAGGAGAGGGDAARTSECDYWHIIIIHRAAYRR